MKYRSGGIFLMTYRKGLWALFRRGWMVRTGPNGDSSNKAMLTTDSSSQRSKVISHFLLLLKVTPSSLDLIGRQNPWTSVFSNLFGSWLSCLDEHYFNVNKYQLGLYSSEGKKRPQAGTGEPLFNWGILLTAIHEALIAGEKKNQYILPKVNLDRFLFVTQLWDKHFNLCGAGIKIHKVTRCIALIYSERSQPTTAFHSSLTDIFRSGRPTASCTAK